MDVWRTHGDDLFIIIGNGGPGGRDGVAVNALFSPVSVFILRGGRAVEGSAILFWRIVATGFFVDRIRCCNAYILFDGLTGQFFVLAGRAGFPPVIAQPDSLARTHRYRTG